MKLSKMTKAATVALLLGAFGITQTFAGSEKNKSHKQSAEKNKRVALTGSNIPEKVKVKSVGTLTTSPTRIYKRDEINKTGRFTTERVLAQDPSVQIHGFGAAGPNN
jgi:outer membrane receptor for Fe3+-dicitrate